MTPEEYIINRIQELEKENDLFKNEIISSKAKINNLEKRDTTLLDLLHFIMENFRIVIDTKNRTLSTMIDKIPVGEKEIRDIANFNELLKGRENGPVLDCSSALRENQYRSFSYNTLEKDPKFDKVVKVNE